MLEVGAGSKQRGFCDGAASNRGLMFDLIKGTGCIGFLDP